MVTRTCTAPKRVSTAAPVKVPFFPFDDEPLLDEEEALLDPLEEELPAADPLEDPEDPEDPDEVDPLLEVPDPPVPEARVPAGSSGL
jgi:hypothetical protein